MKRGRITISFFTIFLFALFCPNLVCSATKITIGIIFDGPWENNEKHLSLFKKETSDLIRDEFDIRFPKEKMLVSNWTFKGVSDTFSQLIEDPEVDIIMTFGTFSSHIAATRASHPKPVICPFVMNVKLQAVPIKDGKSGVKNLHYLHPASTQKTDLEFFYRVVKFKKAALFINKQAIENFPGFERNIREAAESFGANIQIIKVGKTIDKPLGLIEKDVNAVLIAPLPQLRKGEFKKLVKGMIKKKLPTFSSIGESEVEQGLLCAARPKTYYPKLYRRLALNLHRILLGEEPSSLPVGFELKDNLIINMATARSIGLIIPFKEQIDAKLLNEAEETAEKHWTLNTAVAEAIKSNLDLAVSRKEVSSGEFDYKKARTQFFPQIEISAMGRMIDSDQAEASFGIVPERQINGTLKLTQVIFAEKLWANEEIQKELQQARVYDLSAIELDTAYNAVISYLNVLRTKTFLKIKINNIKRNRSYLELAKSRNKVGAAGPSEVYRLESEITRSQTDMNKARSKHEIARRRFNRQLNRPLIESFTIKEIGVEDPSFFFGGKWVTENITDDRKFALMRQFMENWTVQNSPELQQIDAVIKAQKRALLSSKASNYMPTVALTAEATQNMWKDDPGAIEGTFSQYISGIQFPEVNDTDLMVGIQISLPLYKGGAKILENKKEAEKLKKLMLKRKSAANKLKQHIRSAIHKTEASFPNIELSKMSAEAARKNLDLVTAAYSRGAVSIQELLDAQNAAFVSEQLASNSIYAYLIDLTEVERISGLFTYFLTDQKRNKFFDQVNTYFKEKLKGP